MGPTQVRDHCPVDETGRQLLGAAMCQMNLSARAYHRVLKLAHNPSIEWRALSWSAPVQFISVILLFVAIYLIATKHIAG